MNTQSETETRNMDSKTSISQGQWIESILDYDGLYDEVCKGYDKFWSHPKRAHLKPKSNHSSSYYQ